MIKNNLYCDICNSKIPKKRGRHMPEDGGFGGYSRIFICAKETDKNYKTVDICDNCACNTTINDIRQYFMITKNKEEK